MHNYGRGKSDGFSASTYVERRKAKDWRGMVNGAGEFWALGDLCLTIDYPGQWILDGQSKDRGQTEGKGWSTQG